MTPELREKIEALRGYEMSPHELFEQRVSFVYGQQDWSSDKASNKDEIRQMLAKSTGWPENPAMGRLAKATKLDAQTASDAEWSELLAAALDVVAQDIRKS
jgi:hypothetical protein